MLNAYRRNNLSLDTGRVKEVSEMHRATNRRIWTVLIAQNKNADPMKDPR